MLFVLSAFTWAEVCNSLPSVQIGRRWGWGHCSADILGALPAELFPILSDLEPKLKSNYQSAEEACISLLGGFPLWFSNKDLLLSHHCLVSAAASMLRPFWDIITSLWFPSAAGSCALEKILSGNKKERDIPETQLCWVVIHCFMERNLRHEAHVLLLPRAVELEGERPCTKIFCR